MIRYLTSAVLILTGALLAYNLQASDFQEDQSISRKISEKYKFFGALYPDILQIMQTNKPLPNSISLGLKQLGSSEDKIYGSIKNGKKTVDQAAELIVQLLETHILPEILERGAIVAAFPQEITEETRLQLREFDPFYDDFDTKDEFVKVLCRVVDLERKYPAYLVFYSANDPKASFLYEIYTITYLKKNNLPAVPNQKILRYQSPPPGWNVNSALDFWNHMQSLDRPEILDKKGELSDCSKVFSTHMVSASKTVLLADFSTVPVESAIAALLLRQAVRSVNLEALLLQFFVSQKIELSAARLRVYLDLFESDGQSMTGRLQQIFIKNTEKDLVYLAEPFGFPSLVDRQPSGEYYGKIDSKNVRPLESSLPDDQVRILCDPLKFLNPDLVKVVEHGWGNYSEEKRKILIEKLNEMLSKDLNLEN